MPFLLKTKIIACELGNSLLTQRNITILLQCTSTCQAVEYWCVLNSNSKQKSEVAPFNDRYECFRNVNVVKSDDTVLEIDIGR